MSLPEKFGRYQVLTLLGQGAMGMVYKAVDPVIERGVAIKVIQANPGLGPDELERMQARFEQEFRSAGALSHPHIVTVFDVGKEGDLYYIAMEYVDGRGLDAVLAQRRVLTFAEVGRLARELGSALDYAHAQGVVHRDIKPANVLITGDGDAKVTDFGLAKLEATTLTRTGALVGTPAYMSPEQVGGRAISGKTDQFSLAILLYQALTAERPFTGDSPSTIMYKIAHEEPLSACRVNQSLPAAVDEVLLRALSKSTEARFDTCSAFAGALCGALGISMPESGTVVSAADDATVVQTVAAPAAGQEGRGPSTVSPGSDDTAPPATGPENRGASAAAGSMRTIAQPASPEGSVAAPGVPRWLLVTGIVLPSLALLALVGWLIASGAVRGDRPQEPPDSGSDGLVAGTDGAGAPAAGGAATNDPAGGNSGDDAAPVSTTGAAAGEKDGVGSLGPGGVEEEGGAANDQTGAAGGGDEPGIGAVGSSDDPPSQPAAGDTQAARGGDDAAPTRDPSTRNDDPARNREAAAGGDDPARFGQGTVGGRDAAGRGALGRIADAIDAFVGMPPQLQALIDSGEVPTGTVVVETPFDVGVHVAPSNLPQSVGTPLRALMRNATPEQRRRVASGFLLEASDRHEVALPVGNWRVTVISPRIFLYHEQEVALRPGRRVDVGAQVPQSLVPVSISSDPPGARVRTGRLRPVPTPFEGLIVAGEHELEFLWSDGRTTTHRVTVERAGERIVGRAQQPPR